MRGKARAQFPISAVALKQLEVFDIQLCLGTQEHRSVGDCKKRGEYLWRDSFPASDIVGTHVELTHVRLPHQVERSRRSEVSPTLGSTLETAGHNALQPALIRHQTCETSEPSFSASTTQPLSSHLGVIPSPLVVMLDVLFYQLLGTVGHHLRCA